jgi:hypothetical protein
VLSPDAKVLFFPSGVNLKIESVPLSKRLPAASKASPPAWVLMESKIVSMQAIVTATNNFFISLVKLIRTRLPLLRKPALYLFDPLLSKFYHRNFNLC